MVSVADTTTVKEILQQCHAVTEGCIQDRQANLLRGVMFLEPDTTVSEAGLGHGDEISLVWSDPFVEMASWTGEQVGKDLYVRIPPGTTGIDPGAFSHCKSLVKVLIPNSVTGIGERAFADCSWDRCQKKNISGSKKKYSRIKKKLSRIKKKLNHSTERRESSVLWSSAPLVLWSPGPLVLWSSGRLVLWCPGPLVL